LLSLEVSCPSTLAEAGSDLCRVCLPRLCYACRFSQPLDAFFRQQPFQPCFMPVTPLGFRLSEISPSFRPMCLATHRPLLAVMAGSPRTVANALPPMPLSFKGVSSQEVRSLLGRFYPVRAGRASHSLLSFEVYPRRPWLRASTVPPLLGFSMLLPVTRHQHTCSTEFQRTGELDALFRDSSSLRGLFVVG
jgi:hypothetical protein